MKIFALLLIVMMAVSCTTKDDVKKMLKEDPSILTDAIKANPGEIFSALQAAAKQAQQEQAKKAAQDESKAMEGYYDKPLQANKRSDDIFRGTKGAPIKIIEFSDFECYYCGKGFATIVQLLEKYPGKIEFVFRHLPLSFHKQAMISAQYYEALRLQSHEKAIKFHDGIFKNQGKLKNGEAFLKKLAKEVGADMAKLAKDYKSKAIQKRIDEDMAEAAKFGFQGTPGFLLNGIPLKGAYPITEFDKIIGELKKRGKINI